MSEDVTGESNELPAQSGLAHGSRRSITSLPRDAADSTHRRVVCQGLYPTRFWDFATFTSVKNRSPSVPLRPHKTTTGSAIVSMDAMAKGGDPKAIMAEMFGKATGCSKGQGGSMHLFDKEKRFMGGYGIVGAHVPMANGVAGPFVTATKAEFVCTATALHTRCLFAKHSARATLSVACGFHCENTTPWERP